MDDLTLMVTMDVEGRLFIEAVVPVEFVEPLDAQRTKILIPIPRNVALPIGQALITGGTRMPRGSQTKPD